MKTYRVELTYEAEAGNISYERTMAVTPDTHRLSLPRVGEAIPGGDVLEGDPVVVWVCEEGFVLMEDEIFPGITASVECLPAEELYSFGYVLEREEGTGWVVFERRRDSYDTPREAFDAAVSAWNDVLSDIAEIVRKAECPRWLAWDVARDVAVASGFHDQANDIAEAVFHRLYPDAISDAGGDA